MNEINIINGEIAEKVGEETAGMVTISDNSVQAAGDAQNVSSIVMQVAEGLTGVSSKVKETYLDIRCIFKGAEQKGEESPSPA